MKSKYRYVLPEIQALLASKDLFAKATSEPTRYSYADALLALGGRTPTWCHSMRTFPSP